MENSITALLGHVHSIRSKRKCFATCTRVSVFICALQLHSGQLPAYMLYVHGPENGGDEMMSYKAWGKKVNLNEKGKLSGTALHTINSENHKGDHIQDTAPQVLTVATSFALGQRYGSMGKETNFFCGQHNISLRYCISDDKSFC